jgi:hypothetical protein
VEGGHHNDLFADRGASPLPELAAFARAATAPR